MNYEKIPLPEFVQKYIGSHKNVKLKWKMENYRRTDFSKLNQTEKTLENLSQMKTPKQINEAYAEFINKVESAPNFIQRELQQFYFPLYLHLAKTLLSQIMKKESEAFIEKFKSVQPQNVKGTIQKLLDDINSLHVPEYDIKITRISHSYLLSLLDSEKLSIISIIIMKDIKYTIKEQLLEKMPQLIKKRMIRNEYDQIEIIDEDEENDAEDVENHFISDIIQLTLYNHHDRISEMKISNNGRLFAYAQNTTASLFVLNDSRTNFQFPNKQNSIEISKHYRGISALCFSENSCMIASGGLDNDIRIAHTEACAQIAHFSYHSLPILDVSFMPNSYIVLGASMDKSLSLWSMESPKIIRLFLGHTGPITCTSFARQNMLASGSMDGTIRIWDVGDAQQYIKLTINEAPSCIFMHKDTSDIICGTKEGSVIAFNGTGGEIWRTQTNSLVTDVKITQDGKHALFSCENGVVETWTMNGERRARIQNKETTIKTLTIYDDDTVFCAGLSKRGQ